VPGLVELLGEESWVEAQAARLRPLEEALDKVLRGQEALSPQVGREAQRALAGRVAPLLSLDRFVERLFLAF